MSRIFLSLVLLLVIACTCWVQGEESSVVSGPYTADWESLQKHDEAPEWFRDAKFGIYFHWGVYSVPAFGSEWYPRNMHLKDRGEYRHHLETYGPPTEFGYHDFVPQFKAEKFDATQWAKLFQQAGARFAGPVAEHHDGFSMWDSQVTPWNAADEGPQRDLTGELERAIRQRGMRFITTFHHARNNLWQKGEQWTGHYDGIMRDFPSLLEDPKNAILYGYLPREQFCRMWRDKLIEVIDKYQPDLIWFDSWLDQIPESYRQEFLAYYLNHAAANHQDVVVTYKQQDLPRDVAVEDFEKGRADHLTEYVWLTDDTISRGSWCYTDNLTIKPTDEVLHSMIDIVSKNGILLLNISPMADGSIPENQQHVLLEMGKWLQVCGEAIYDTRPWQVYGEGPTRMGKGGAFIRWRGKYRPQDIRFTQSKDGKTLYAIALGWPDSRRLLVRSLATAAGDVEAVRLLGHDGKLTWQQTEEGLAVTLPENPVSDYALALAIDGQDLQAVPVPEVVITVDADPRGNYTLKPDDAKLDGSRIKVEARGGQPNLGFWDDARETAAWTLHAEKIGRFAVSASCATVHEGASLTVEIGSQLIGGGVPKTGSWDAYQQVDLGEVEIKKTGLQPVKIRATDPQTWKAINVRQLQLKRLPSP